MHAAGPSLCKQFKLLPESTLEMLDKMDKKAKNIKVGLIQKHDKEFTKKLLEAFALARKWFLESNNLEEDRIISIKKDAIFTANQYCDKTQMGYVEFHGKNHYTSYIRLNKLEFYINTKTNQVDIKGLGQGDSLKEVISLHGDYMIRFILTFCKLREHEVDRQTAYEILIPFVKKYKTKKLPIEYYRELARGNSYHVWDEDSQDYIRIEDTDDIENIDISLNYQEYILPLVNLYI